jgi:YHS domain-containing protein
MPKDPVCGADVGSGAGPHEQDYLFCSEECRVKFMVNPGRYMGKT